MVDNLAIVMLGKVGIQYGLVGIVRILGTGGSLEHFLNGGSGGMEVRLGGDFKGTPVFKWERQLFTE